MKNSIILLGLLFSCGLLVGEVSSIVSVAIRCGPKQMICPPHKRCCYQGWPIFYCSYRCGSEKFSFRRN
ncbi:unnamed protein product, partial [Mesorhabditis belari]|uniref:Uncharacterized protein n=1 Tax=Mesorhabditis belari TaxID=2138241 RepID=A0A915H4Y9_9BILA